MIKLYLKQAWTLIKQHRLFTGIYVVGTGLSIALSMTMFIIFYVKFAAIYPEYNRDRMIVLKMMKSYPKNDDKSWNCSGVSYDVVKMLQDLPHLNAIGATSSNYRENYVEVPDNNEPIGIAPLYTDTGFWQVFTFHFLYGKPFTQADVDAKRREVVVPVSLARRLFAVDDVVGRYFKMDAQEYRICGVVDDVSAATPSSVGDIWMPITLNSWIVSDNTGKLVGNAQIYMTAPTAADKEVLKEEVREVFRKFNLAAPKYMNDLMGQPDDYWTSTFRVNSCGAPDLASELRVYLYMLLALLFIPAMNLSGMMSSRMDERLAELGVRKTYGATNGSLIGQVLWENLLLTCIGGLLGLLISYLIVLTASDWILTLFDSYTDVEKTPFLSFEMLFNPMVFCTAFGLCVLLNLISALIPAVWALRRTITQSLNSKR
ncbi:MULTISPECIES: ABC transporter permease [Bacteroides]|jgi:ABC-type antimicrobial peptide transport system permease subunit|uniref:ABC transporter permease n=1 Tax=Bacteroides TaxID=816 RepID=UPI000E51380A|nr:MULTISPECIES: ABC transporter permease [Bacteroides]RHL07605.1 ABC transporter permease [Bacteroides sp. AF39-11AC]